ncbi:MAG: stress response serine/threonine protein kinase YihE [Candidatus Dactylopiibacterium carminicum]|uniref:Stress response kinase A n=1 Tax=Candidatus Dactylopiibacterium carminicum TaxID=857335 RepID=A0A272EZ45_9RHOO|nr:serine/threonine protein kinase [Candidatus Dactylopiibacterium carminicum]KAF7600893.1 serine/threonine protein kinase [Candidatus Dactylopiibacterium carminicum]PAS95392.1 MAG: stress response serine/threonine protein kinase YihE [Candidatus Dactylopiibacterium carminicum]PAT00890.1 MAG: stress response serine/threonine protein kinase YihE [Candidatus Dactylopiibacterium carminicum]
MSDAPHPFATLTPDRVLDAIDATGLRTDGRLLALNSYENRVYQAGLEEGGFIVAKFYRPDRWSDAAIREEHAFTRALAEAEIPAVPPLLRADGDSLTHAEGFRVAVFPRRGGRSLELNDPEVLEWLGRFIGRIHAVGATAAFRERLTLDVATWGEAPSAFVLASPHLPSDLCEAYRGAVSAALEGVHACFERAGDITRLRLHGDCHPGNVMWTDAGPHFVDFDDACTGPAVQDLWMLLSGERGEMTRQLADLVAGYEDFREFNPREVDLIEALRTLRLIHHAAWLARRWDDPAFPTAFPWFNTRGWWEEHIGNLRDQLPRMAEPWRF